MFHLSWINPVLHIMVQNNCNFTCLSKSQVILSEPAKMSFVESGIEKVGRGKCVIKTKHFKVPRAKSEQDTSTAKGGESRPCRLVVNTSKFKLRLGKLIIRPL